MSELDRIEDRYTMHWRDRARSSAKAAHSHLSDDDTVLYEGGTDCLGRDCIYPGVIETLDHWADYNSCTTTRTENPTTIDLDSSLAGAETSVERYDGYPSTIDIELWTIEAGAHIPTLRNNFHLPT